MTESSCWRSTSQRTRFASGRPAISEARRWYGRRAGCSRTRDRGLSFDQRVGALAEARAAPRLADLGAGLAEHVGDRFAAEARIRSLDVLLHGARAGEHDELLRGLRRALRARGPDDERGLEQ